MAGYGCTLCHPCTRITLNLRRLVVSKQRKRVCQIFVNTCMCLFKIMIASWRHLATQRWIGIGSGCLPSIHNLNLCWLGHQRCYVEFTWLRFHHRCSWTCVCSECVRKLHLKYYHVSQCLMSQRCVFLQPGQCCAPKSFQKNCCGYLAGSCHVLNWYL